MTAANSDVGCTDFSYYNVATPACCGAWTEGFPIDASALAPAADVVSALGDAVAGTFGPKRSYALDRRAAVMMLAGLLEHFPNEGAGSSYEPTDDDIETQAAFVQRVLLARPDGGS